MPTGKKELDMKKAEGWANVNILLTPEEVKKLETLKTFLGIKSGAGVFHSLLATSKTEGKSE